VKRGFSSLRFDHVTNPQSNKVVRMLGAWFGDSSPHHNIKAFMHLGLILVERKGRGYEESEPLGATLPTGISINN
jgi:hypothetical protein